MGRPAPVRRVGGAHLAHNHETLHSYGTYSVDIDGPRRLDRLTDPGALDQHHGVALATRR